VVGIFEISRLFESVIDRDWESFQDSKSVENFLMHISTTILALNVYYYLQKKYENA
jgi:hypothetical protein